MLGLSITLSRRIYDRWHIYLWEEGFIYEKKRVRQTFQTLSWEEIQELTTNDGTVTIRKKAEDG